MTREQVSDKVTILQQNGFTVDLTPANVITLYYLRRGVELLKPKLLRELQPGTRVISVKFPVPGWRPVRRVKMFEYYVHLYTMPPQLLSVHEEAEMLHEYKDLDDIGTWVLRVEINIYDINMQCSVHSVNKHVIYNPFYS